MSPRRWATHLSALMEDQHFCATISMKTRNLRHPDDAPHFSVNHASAALRKTAPLMAALQNRSILPCCVPRGGGLREHSQLFRSLLVQLSTISRLGAVQQLGAEIEVTGLKLGKEDAPAKWKAISKAMGDSVAIFRDGSRSEEGGVGGGWCWKQVVVGESEGSRWVGTEATVWDGEIAGMRGALEAVDGRAKELLLANS
ncbi:hypothetical protein BDZ91DRAFT_792501 [Kalaharituber pfeilii]|nr:hypothetical protein BDZ91DRAFT_792501 [Kalaharituber pfeilii]